MQIKFFKNIKSSNRVLILGNKVGASLPVKVGIKRNIAERLNIILKDKKWHS